MSGQSSDIDIVTVAGPLLLSYLANSGLQGVLCVQVYTYYIAFPNDRTILKIIVYATLLFETLQTLILTRDAFDTFVTHLGDIDAIDNVRLTWLAVPVSGGLVAFIGHMFFAYRLRVLSHSWIPSILVVFTAVCAVVSALALGVAATMANKLRNLTHNPAFVFISLWNGSSLVCDVLVAGFMTYYLARQRAITNSRVHRQITRLIRATVETGIISATITVVSLILYTKFRNNVYYPVTSVISSKSYSNTILVILNNRMNIIGGRNEIHMEDQDVTSNWSAHRVGLPWRLRKKEKKGGVGAPGRTGDGVTVLTEVWSDRHNLNTLEVSSIQFKRSTIVSEI
ncbi:hypothetical protein BDZ94DRAFT_1248484 [Collybia nuda]|uniref:DUF6534 domain-containing protein n=1 Tax=Collybia nuda TaxID=64659 RepID=A0A9P6CPE5_9AGAR|nr:hypothetical protein BDZ94DRAFT_1248484 [Collybia nuda]